MFSLRGKLPGTASSRGRTPNRAIIRPIAPPIKERTKLSVRSCRTARERLAPNAIRIANSRVRPAVRVSKRLATFAEAISNTRHTAPNNISNVRLTSPINACRSGTTDIPKPLFASG